MKRLGISILLVSAIFAFFPAASDLRAQETSAVQASTRSAVSESGAASQRKKKTVTLDCYFNNEWRKGPDGRMARWHYLWNEHDNDGFSTLGEVFESNGAHLDTLAGSPTLQKLRNSSVYIIVDPDDMKESPAPHIISEKEVAAICDWVRSGGVLLLMGNDSGHTNIRSMNVLSSKFGITLNEDLFNTVQGDVFERGAVDVSNSKDVFSTARKIFVKDIATLAVNPPATAIVTKEGKHIMATATYGKGTVFVIGDPWLYNEYTDGRKLPDDFDNYEAAQDLARWLLARAR